MRRRIGYTQWVFMIIDLVLINVAFILAIQFRFLRMTDFGYTEIYMQNALAISVIYLLVFNLTRVYKMVFTQKMWEEIRYCFIANLIAPVAVFLYAVLFSERLPYSVYLLTMMVATYLTVGIRLGLGIIFSIYRNIKYGNSKIENRAKVLIIGAGEAARTVIEEMKYKKRHNVVAVLDDSAHKLNRFINGIRVVGSLDDLEKAVKSYDIDEIIFCITMIDAAKKRDILKRCAETGLKVKTIPSIYDIVDESVTITNFRNIEIEDLLDEQPYPMKS